jgi:hypothetical protein
MLSDTQKISDERFKVNNICEILHQNRTVILGKILFDIVLSHQETRLNLDLGSRYSRKKVIASFICSVCGGRLFTRKGKRTRVFKSVLGKTKLPIVQVRCILCQHRFCPYKDQIGLAFTDRISQTLRQRQLELTCQISYNKARRFIESCLSISSCPMTIRKEIDKQANAIRQQPVTAKDELVYLDSTKVKAGLKERGESIHLAVTAKPGVMIGKRHTMNKSLLFLKTGDADQIKNSLKSIQAKGIVHDGDMDLTGCAPLIQRCLWHLPHQLGHYLWEDGLPVKAREPYVKELIHILHLCPLPDMEMKIKYRLFMEKLKEKDLSKSFKHLKNAENELTTSREHKFDYHTTSPVEREMREINRRVDVGVRWSIPGVENLLLVKTYKQLNKP